MLLTPYYNPPEHFHGSEHHHDSAGLCHDHPHSDGDEGDGDAHACGHADDRKKREGSVEIDVV